MSKRELRYRRRIAVASSGTVGASRPSDFAAIMVPVALLISLAALVAFDKNTSRVGVVSCAVSAVTASYAAIWAVIAARSGRRNMRAFWVIMVVAMAAWAVGDLVWGWYHWTRHHLPTSSIADVFHLGSVVLIGVAMVRFPVDPKLRSRLRGALEGVTAGLCLFLLSWVLVYNRIFDSFRAGQIEFDLVFVYPVVDVISLAVAVGVLIGAEARQRTVLWLLTVSILVFTVTDHLYAATVADGHFRLGGLLDVGWVAALVGFAAAAVLSRRAVLPAPPAVPLPPHASVWLPYVPFLVCGTVGPFIVMRGFESVLVPVIVTAVCLRQAVAAWENRRLLRATAEHALRDPLTGLANRALFQDRLAHAMMMRLRDDRPMAVVSIDLDDFKFVNDSVGHSTGDRLLVAVGDRIAENIRAGDTAARLDEDEFGIVLEGPDDDVQAVLKQVVEAINEPFLVDGHDLLVRPSVGVAVARSADLDVTADKLMMRAHAAMHAAKRARSNRVHTYDRDTELLDPDVADGAGANGERRAVDGAARVRLLGELRHAIDHSLLALVYQPKFDLRTGEMVGVEALLRWPHPTLGTVRPDAFLSLIHQHGLMRPVTDLVVEMALDDAATWLSQEREVPVAVNLFAPSLRNLTLPDTLFAELSKRNLPESVLTVEITEDMVLSDITLVTGVLHRLRDRGIRVAVDDFGSGYSALSYLRDLSIDEVKLDRHLVATVTTDSRAAAVVRAVIDLTHDLGMTVVAEGIEDPDTAAWLLRNNCDIGQGYHFGRPAPAEQILTVMPLGSSHIG